MYHSKEQIQNIERRSIALYHPNEGVQSMPVSIDRTVFKKTTTERDELKEVQCLFKYEGLHSWNERNRPGNNKN